MERFETFGSTATLTWGVFLLLALFGVFIAAGIPFAPLLLLGGVIAIAWSYRYIYAVFYFGVALAPLLGITVSIPTGQLLLGERAFGGSIDISLAEVVFLCVLTAWALKLLVLWRVRRDQTWKPRLPLFRSYFFLIAAHVLSVFSPLEPDPVLVLKFAVRPVLFDYLAFIALPANLIRSRRRLVAMLGTWSVVGGLAAFNGLISLFFPDSGSFLGRAHPIAIFGVPALGENHNELAEMLVSTTLFSLALSVLAKTSRARRFAAGAAAFQFAIGLLTFTRTIWIVFAVQILFLLATEWRQTVKKHLRSVCITAMVLLPLALGMAAYSVSRTAQSSDSTRLMLTQIAFQVFQSSPWFGGGAGTFFDRVGSTQIFLLEYGDPLDSHGFIQKLAAETGSLGLLALAALMLHAVFLFFRAVPRMASTRARRAYILIVTGAGGAFLYQFFNTSYWNGKMWLPIGIALAAIPVLADLQEGEASE